MTLGLSCLSNSFFTIMFHNFPQSSFLTTRDSFTTTAFLFTFASYIVTFILSYCQCWLPDPLFLASTISQIHYGLTLDPQKLLLILVEGEMGTTSSLAKLHRSAWGERVKSHFAWLSINNLLFFELSRCSKETKAVQDLS